MRDLHNIVATHRKHSADTQVTGRGPTASGLGQIQPWYHIRENQVVYGMILAAITGYM